MPRPDSDSIRPPAVAGLFYPAEAATLDRAVARLLETADRPEGPAPKAVIAPHAGYPYSGAVAGNALVALAPTVERVILIGPAHRHAPRRIALPAAAALATPLGVVEVDRELAAAALEMPQVEIDDEAHRREHSLEVELPFLQLHLGRFTVLPLVVGAPAADEVAEVLERLWGDDGTAVVVSSDLSHYLPYDEARRADAATAAAITEAVSPVGPEQACGAFAINGLLRAIAGRGLAGRAVDLRNSGDTAGDRSRVVGYGAFHFGAS